MKVQLESIKKPNGEKEFPAKTCKDLAIAYPELQSGNYWIDPNDGDVRDAILVYCDMKERTTCVMPKPSQTAELTYDGNDPEIWLGDMKEGIKITYKADSNQMGFLQLLSEQASQNITFNCKNTVAYFDKERNSHK